ncbi:putative glycosyl transferase (Group 2 family protein) [Desulfamplus magnetovallimortis]|uniref:Putative glycosyl transferase (Group 2 family protein) n=1 Tax=Desulfamplus magnetovallimortis TaxID=1246637 RepID=A0A1W1HC02_9BACT|nr:glycosyltransferase [Desulfamplus magnetovallimortis]SLM29979.1 putative glycosyl transferase (Group 2 family protein) [Desulfamplus magnetovallimortis]
MKESLEKYGAFFKKMFASSSLFKKGRNVVFDRAYGKIKERRSLFRERDGNRVDNEDVSPPDMPDDRLLKFWASSEWAEYQAWIFHNDFITCDDWKEMRKRAVSFKAKPLISVITPTYNTDTEMLLECIRSVQSQAYPFWEMCIADDGSTSSETLELLRETAAFDPRIKVSFLPENHGICHATNNAIGMASGEYLAFLDHDDRISPAAFYYVADALNHNYSLDVIYSDRDMLSTRGLRFMHLFKPGWSPELLFSMNYICHLMVYKKSLVDMVGGVHEEFEGSQDYDLVLRVMEKTKNVHHISRVLYHWRQSEQSVALNHNVKDYAYKAGVKALEHALKRRNLNGTVQEISTLWRGHYRVQLDGPSSDDISVHYIENDFPLDQYVTRVNKEFSASSKKRPFLLFVGQGLTASDAMAAYKEMASWLQVEGVGIVTGKIVDAKKRIVHAGMVQKSDGVPLFTYEGADASVPGYIAATAVVRNVSAPHPWCFAVRRDVWDSLGGFARGYIGPHAVIDFSLRAEKQGYRTVFTPFADFLDPCESIVPASSWPQEDVVHFLRKWQARLTNGDLYYNKNLTLKLEDMGLDYSVSK